MTETAVTPKYSRFTRWTVWLISTALGWLMTLATISVIIFASGTWDPDEVEAYLNTSLSERLLIGLSTGLVYGLIIGGVIGLVRWLAWRRPAKQALTSMLLTLTGIMVLCGISSLGGPDDYESAVTRSLRVGLQAGLVGGVVSGWGQAAFLRRLARVNGWLWLTVIGWAFGWIITLILTSLLERGDPTWRFPFIALLAGGTAAGLVQWFGLRPLTGRAVWWIPATALGWGLAFVPTVLGEGYGLVVMSGLLVGLIPATTLLWLLPETTTNHGHF